MAYDKEDLYTQAKELISADTELVFFNDLINDLGLSVSTFYAHFPASSEESKHLKKMMRLNKARIKRKLRQNWLDPDASASLQISLYKLLADDNELKRLNNTPEKATEKEHVIKIENYIPLTKD